MRINWAQLFSEIFRGKFPLKSNSKKRRASITKENYWRTAECGSSKNTAKKYV